MGIAKDLNNFEVLKFHFGLECKTFKITKGKCIIKTVISRFYHKDSIRFSAPPFSENICRKLVV